MPNLENLKKQAKALVRLHAERSYHLSSVAREVMPKFAGRSDREILAGEFKLSDAQELIARQHGCETWSELKAKTEAAPAEPPGPAAVPPGLITALPMLYVADVTRSLAWYTEVLGFSERMQAGQPPFYAEVGREGVQLSLRLVHQPAIDPKVRASETMLWQASVRVTNAKALFLEFTAAGAEFEAPLYREPWGVWAFAVKDPDGNIVSFGEAVQPAAG